MRKRIKLGFLLPLVALFLCILSPIDAQGKEVQEVETEGSVQFTGIYEPIGKPEPTPPDGIEKPPSGDTNRPDDGSLPKTNMMNDSHLYWAGVGTLFFLIILWKRKNQKENQKQTKNKQQVGIIT